MNKPRLCWLLNSMNGSGGKESKTFFAVIKRPKSMLINSEADFE
jgi:hypothetical protein